jgi:hypothetical protein
MTMGCALGWPQRFNPVLDCALRGEADEVPCAPPALTAGQDIGVCEVAHSGGPIVLIHRRHSTRDLASAR